MPLAEHVRTSVPSLLSNTQPLPSKDEDGSRPKSDAGTREVIPATRAMQETSEQSSLYAFQDNASDQNEQTARSSRQQGEEACTDDALPLPMMIQLVVDLTMECLAMIKVQQVSMACLIACSTVCSFCVRSALGL